MTIAALSPVRIASEALLLAGAVLLAGLVLRGQNRPTADVPLDAADDDFSFDDTGIPLRLAGFGPLREPSTR
jgi:hypothetical protein